MEDFTAQSSSAAQSALPVRDWVRGLQGRLEERPYETLAIAAGVGFILGGGLFSRLGARAVAAAARAGLATAASPVVSALLQEFVQGSTTDSSRVSPAQRPS
jgi:hypothetical protein